MCVLVHARVCVHVQTKIVFNSGSSRPDREQRLCLGQWQSICLAFKKFQRILNSNTKKEIDFLINTLVDKETRHTHTHKEGHYLAFKTRDTASCNMVEPGGCYTKWNKTQTGKKTQYILTYMKNKKSQIQGQRREFLGDDQK